MGNFRAKAINATTLSNIFDGRSKISTSELIQNFPKGITIKDFDIVSYTKTIKGQETNVRFPVFCFKEDDSICYSGGTVLMKMVDNWVADYSGDLEACRQDFIAEGGVKIRLEDGGDYTRVIVL